MHAQFTQTALWFQWCVANSIWPANFTYRRKCLQYIKSLVSNGLCSQWPLGGSESWRAEWCIQSTTNIGKRTTQNVCTLQILLKGWNTHTQQHWQLHRPHKHNVLTRQLFTCGCLHTLPYTQMSQDIFPHFHNALSCRILRSINLLAKESFVCFVPCALT